MNRFTHKVAVVTGGASGMSEAICYRLAQEGAFVGVLDMDETGGERVVAALRAQGAPAIYCRADVTDAGSMERAVAAVVAQFGHLDIAVNGAGIGGGIHPLTEFPPEAWTRTIMVNLVGVFHSMRAEIPAMLGKGGAIVNIASTVSTIAHPNTSAYVASKHGLLGLTKSAALEWAAKGIRINAVGPTFVRTPMTAAILDTDEQWARLDAEHPIGRCARAEDVAALVAFLASDEAAMVTGSLHLVDGGYTAR